MSSGSQVLLFYPIDSVVWVFLFYSSGCVVSVLLFYPIDCVVSKTRVTKGTHSKSM